MSDQKPEDEGEKTESEQPKGGITDSGQGEYNLGYGRPPKEYQFKRGQSGNPRGRPRGQLNRQAIWEKIMNEPMYLRDGDGNTRKVPKYEGLCQAHLTKGIKGDTHSAKFAMDEAERAGFGEEQKDIESGTELAPVRSKEQVAQSDALFENIDLDLLSEEDKVDLARLAAFIDLGGDFTALSTGDFERVKEIANKGRGKDVTPQQ